MSDTITLQVSDLVLENKDAVFDLVKAAIKAKMPVKKQADRNGNGDDVFKGTNVKEAPRLPSSNPEVSKEAGFDGIQEEWGVIDTHNNNRLVSVHLKETVARSAARVNNTAHWHKTKKSGRYAVESLRPAKASDLEKKKKKVNEATLPKGWTQIDRGDGWDKHPDQESVKAGDKIAQALRTMRDKPATDKKGTKGIDKALRSLREDEKSPKEHLTELAAIALEMASTGVVTESILISKILEMKGE